MSFKFKKLKNRIIALGTASTITIGAVCGAFYFGGVKAEAKLTLRGIESIVETHTAEINAKDPDPFIILEVVPSYDKASLGYLVGGEEPIDDKAHSIKDMPSSDERIAKLGEYNPYSEFKEGDLFYRLAKKDAIKWNNYTEYEKYNERTNLINIRGRFYGKEGEGRYDENDFSNAYIKRYGLEAGLLDVTTLYGNKNISNVVLYRKTNAYRMADDFYKGQYSFSIRKIKDDAAEMPVEAEDGIYNFQYFKAKKITDTDEFIEDQYIYTCAPGASGEVLDYYGQVVADLDADGNYQYDINGKKLLKVKLKDDTYVGVKELDAEWDGEPIPTATPTPEGEVDPSESPSPSATPEGEIDPSESPSPSATPIDGEETPTPSATPEDGVEPTATPIEGAETPTPTATPEDGAEPTATPEASETATPTATPESDLEEPTATPAPAEDAEGTAKGISDNRNNNLNVLDLLDTKAVLGAIRSDVFDYYVVTETNSADTGCYRIDTIEEGTGPLGVKYGYSKVLGDTYNSTNAAPDKGPYYIKTLDQDDYMYVPTEDGDYDFFTDYSQDIYQTFFSTGGYTNAEWFKQYVLDRELGEECDKLYVDVVPITIDKLGDYLDAASLVYFAGERYPEDLEEEAAQRLLNKVAEEDFPVMIEKSTYYANLHINIGETEEEMAERVNLTLLYLELMQPVLKTVVDDDDEKAKDKDKTITVSDWRRTVKEFSDRIVADVILPGMSQAEKDNRSEKRSNLLKSMFYPYNHKIGDATIGDTSFVHGTVFLNDDWDENWDNGAGYPRGRVVPTGRIVSDDFITPYSDAKMNALDGFVEILDEYEAERAIIEAYGNWDDFNHTVSKATSIRYILNANNSRSIIKSKLNILDVEPYESAQYTDAELLRDMYMNAWGSTLWTAKAFERRDNLEKDWVFANLMGITTEEQKKDYTVNIKQMGTKELIGRNDDLNATYDLIYIGMDTAIMNTDNDPWYPDEVKRFDPIYNFSQQGKLVYSHLGEPYEVSCFKYNGQKNTAGNDITSDKLRELTEYIQAGYAVLLSDDFFALDERGRVKGINEDKVDISSNMYKLIRDVVLKKDGDGGYAGDADADEPADRNSGYKYFGKNVYRRGALETGTAGYTSAREIFSKYVNIAKLDVEVIKTPVAYNGEDGKPHYIEQNPDGSYSMNFEVSLSNDTAVDAANTTYDCKLYLDLDADGKFEDGEEQIGLLINDGAEGMADGAFNLRAGNTYTISRTVPDEYVGFLSWKLAFILNDNKYQAEEAKGSVRSAITGFSAVPATGEKPTIKVLQIVPNGGDSKNNLDLGSTEMNNLYNQVDDFAINVTKVSAHDYIHKNDTANRANLLSYFDYLCQYDMVVIGFADTFDLASTQGGTTIDINLPTKDGNGNVTSVKTAKNKLDAYHDAVLAIREYALSGRSILFTHDLTSRSGDPTMSGYESTVYLRDVMGMDRFGYLKENGIDNETYRFDSTNSLKQYESVFDTSVVKGVTSETLGFVDANIMRSKVGDYTYGLTTRSASVNYDAGTAYKDGTRYETVTAINEGQITQYPFLITEGVSGDSDKSTFEASMTHSQYYQLNLDTDSRDENTNDDVVVWYAISNKYREGNDPHVGAERSPLHEYYKAVHNDVRNNYYIYSKGNVMYTGAGHSKVHSDAERKLFVNTLVASYNSGLHAPHVIYKENPWDSAATIKSVHLPYDPEMYIDGDEDHGSGSWLDSTLTVNFKTLNNNFRESRNGLYAKYYVTVPDAGSATLVYNNVYLKEIEPVKFNEFLNGEKQPDGDAHNLSNYHIYQASFNISDLNMGSGVIVKDVGSIYIQIGTEELSSGNVETLLPTESLLENKLSLYTAKLFDLE